MTRWYGVHNNGDLVYLGEFEEIDDADATPLGAECAWLFAEETAYDWHAQLTEFLRK